jgi:RES domain
LPLSFAQTEGLVFRVGYAPDPWAWVPWEYAPFTGRWDDPEALFRTIYAASSVEACYIEILAQFRPDPGLDPDLHGIAGCPEDESYESNPPGVVGRSWLKERRLGTAHLDGWFVDVGHSLTIAELRPVFLSVAQGFGLPDFDAAAVRMHAPREFTQLISRHLYSRETEDGRLASGVAFGSRHGDDLRLWAVFERDADVGRQSSHLLRDCRDEVIDPGSEAFRRALELHGLRLMHNGSGAA